MTDNFIIVNIILTTAALVVSWITYRHNRKSFFQDRLYQIKIDAYNEITARCFEAYNLLDPESEGFVQIYSIQDLEAWKPFWEKNISYKTKIGTDLESLVQKYNVVLSSKVLDKLDNFAGLCITYVMQHYHKDTELNVKTHDKLWELYVDLVVLMRADLHVDKIDRELLSRNSDRIL